ncbi:Fanconi anemia core complex-associated protein 20-like [Crotalus tigris]|uniref:Fanconi anemia core complex-associated protein 20-like n=1 Tax=Crotalus tigris TaxID=88082 RepID=UPI00192F6C98|nr:Fanconi anemia core complex-associated protein 20-like [Crotalus tigris]
MAGLPARGIGGKLSLKRRREDRGGVAGTFSTNASWFEKQELSEAEASWITLLRTVDPHLNQSNLEKFVSFPEFHPKNSQIANPQPPLETFNCGTKTFEWVPFPVYHRDWEATGSGRHQNCTPEETKSISTGENDQDETQRVA